MIKQITVPEDITTMIQRYDVEQTARRNVIAYILSFNDIDITNERFQNYQKEYEEKLFSFEIAKKELEKQYILPEVKDNKTYSWNLDYETNIINLNIKE